MSLLRPSDPTTPPDPLGSRADIHATGITAVVSLAVILLLNGTVFRHGGAPADIVLIVSPAVSYAVSVLTGRCARHRLLKASQSPLPGPVVHLPGEDPNAATAGPGAP